MKKSIITICIAIASIGTVIAQSSVHFYQRYDIYAGGLVFYNFSKDNPKIFIEPEAIMEITDEFTLGIGIDYINFKEKSGEIIAYKSEIIAPRIFSQYYFGYNYFSYNYFVQLEYQPNFKSYQDFINQQNSSPRDIYNTIYAGLGIRYELGMYTYLNTTVLYDFLSEFSRPYDSFNIRFGILTLL